LNVWLNEPPLESCPESKAPLSEVTVCGAESWFVHLTIVPTFTVSDDGEKAKVWTVTEAVAGGGCSEAPELPQTGLQKAAVTAGFRNSRSR